MRIIWLKTEGFWIWDWCNQMSLFLVHVFTSPSCGLETSWTICWEVYDVLYMNSIYCHSFFIEFVWYCRFLVWSPLLLNTWPWQVKSLVSHMLLFLVGYDIIIVSLLFLNASAASSWLATFSYISRIIFQFLETLVSFLSG